MKEKKKGIYGAVIIFILALTFFLGSKARQNGVDAAAIGTVQVEGVLNVRSGPGKSYDVITSGGTGVTLSNGVKVTITGKNGNWYHIKFTLNGKNLTGYVSSDYIKVQTGSVCTKVYGNINVGTVQIRKSASEDASVLKAGSEKISLKKAKKVRVLSESIVKKVKWYYISFSYSSKTYKGYIQAKYVTLLCDKGLPGVLKSESNVALLQTAGKDKEVTVNNNKVSLKNGRQMTILSQTIVSDRSYFYVRLKYNDVSVKGYIPEQYVFLQIVKEEAVAATATPKPAVTVTATPKPTATPTPTPQLTDAEYKEKLIADGFPKSYVSSLLALHKKYPNWKFIPYKTGLKWSTVIKNESVVGLNLLSVNKSYAWKSTEKGAYDWTTDKYIPYDGTTWVTASKKAVKYYMDPRNFLDERGIFQFESLEYQEEYHTREGVEKILNNTPMYNTSFTYTNDSGETKKMKYSTAFIKAASKSGVSPYHLASRVKQEVVISSTLMSSSVSGKVAGYEGIYNFYNIGANNSTVAGGAIANGLSWASSGTTYSRPWNNPYKSIVGGASYIGKNYINVGQNTLYLQKFNVTPNNRYNHQYMANIEAPNSEATKTNTAYNTQKEEMPMVFSIPVYESMPDAACSVPSGGKNPNNYLKSLKVKDYAFDSKFVLGDDGSKVYSLTVANNVTSVKINAKAVAATSKLAGTGTKALKVGTETYTVSVTSESGNKREYKIKITRKEA